MKRSREQNGKQYTKFSRQQDRGYPRDYQEPEDVPARRTKELEMCNQLIKTYNTSIIDSFDPILQVSFMKEAQKCFSKNLMRGNKRNVLARLIYNKEKQKTNPLPKVNYLAGPFNITYHWSKNYNKAIYILGETHDTKEDCPEPKNYTYIDDFLWTHFENPIAFTDFYLEIMSYVLPDGYPNTGTDANHLNILRYTFDPCIDKKTRDENSFCNSSRMHYFDIRQGEIKGGMNSASLFQTEIMHFNTYATEKLKGSDNSNLCLDIVFLKQICIFVESWKSFFEFFALFNIFIEKYEFPPINDFDNVIRGVTPDHKVQLETLGAMWFPNLKDKTGDNLGAFLFPENKKNEIIKWIDKQRKEFNKLNYVKFWYGQIYNSVILKKEMQNMNENVRPLLTMFIKNELDILINSTIRNKKIPHSQNVLTDYKKIKNFLYEYKNDSLKKDDLFFENYGLKYQDISNTISSIYKVFTTQVLYFNVIITDAYLLARIFKTFKIDNPHIEQRKTDEPAEPHNIIIYAGNFHCQNYRKFLRSLGFRVVEKSGPLEKQPLEAKIMKNCVDMTSITQPLFSKWYDYEDEEPFYNYVVPIEYSFDVDFKFDTSTITKLFKEPVVPPKLKKYVSVDRREPVSMDQQPYFMSS